MQFSKQKYPKIRRKREKPLVVMKESWKIGLHRRGCLPLNKTISTSYREGQALKSI